MDLDTGALRLEAGATGVIVADTAAVIAAVTEAIAAVMADSKQAEAVLKAAPLAVTADSKPEAAVRKAAARRKPVALAQRHNPNRSNSKRARRTLAVRTGGNLRRRLQNAITDVSPSYRTKNRLRSTCDPGRFFLFCVSPLAPQPGRDCARPPFALFTIRDTITTPLFDVSTDFLHERYEPGIQNVHSGDRAHDAPARCACRAYRSRQS